jgi:hypothetical protein
LSSNNKTFSILEGVNFEIFYEWALTEPLKSFSRLELLHIEDSITVLSVFLLGNPHLLEGAQVGHDTSSHPTGVGTIRWSENFHLNEVNLALNKN